MDTAGADVTDNLNSVSQHHGWGETKPLGPPLRPVQAVSSPALAGNRLW
jgi:hypothetical protein